MSTTIDFKSVGELKTERKFTPKVNENPIGIKTPMRLGKGNEGILGMHFNVRDQIRDNLKNLILTNHGERLGFYDYGANLKELTMEVASGEFDQESARRIAFAVRKYMPFISLDELKIENDSTNLTNVPKLLMRVTYSIPALNISIDAVDITYYIGA